MPSLGKDLATIRDHLGFSLQDIQHSTKIPLDTLQSIENESIFNEDSEIKTYIRSFVRSYAKALKIDNEVIVKALDQKETGNYNHLLLQEFPGLSKEIPSQVPESEEEPLITPDEEKATTDEKKSSTNKKKIATDQPKSESKQSTSSTEPKPVEQKPQKSSSKKAEPAKKPAANQVDWADVGKRMKKEKKKTPVWLITIFILIILAAIIAFIVYNGEHFETDSSLSETQEETLNEPNGLSLEISEVSPDENTEEAETAAALNDTLFVTVYAAFDRLDPIRVWSDLKPRNDPYWIEQGTAMNFEFENTIRINGPLSQLLLFFNGHRIEDFQETYFNETENAVELTRDIFTSESDWAIQSDLDLPDNVPAPEAITNRPTFN